MRIDGARLEKLERRLEALAPIEIVSWAHATFGPRAAILSSMQRAGTVLCHMADRAGLAFDVLFVDTGVLHAETLATRDRLAATHPHLRVKTLSPRRTFAEQTREEGLLYVSKEGQERCCELRKSAPLREVRGRYDALVAALRIHPFAAMSDEAIAAYVAEHADVVVNPLHAMGFATIGCFPCTTPVRPDEPERAGRWRHLAGVEYCGINPTDRADPSAIAIDLDDRYASALGL
jgi:phosphoadenosine phosphosulfate reductase